MLSMHKARLIILALAISPAVFLGRHARAVENATPAPADGFSGRVELTLENAAVQVKKGQAGTPRPLNLYAECDRGRWDGVWAESDEFNRAIHLGKISEAEVSPGKLRLKVRLMLGSDNWVKGGPATYDVQVNRDAKTETLTGDYSGVFDSVAGPLAVKGKATGRLLPPVAIAPGFQPVKPGEHPRLLVRKSQLPALREKAKTPFGRGLMELLKQSNDPVALGLLYQLTGDKSYAERAKPETVKVMNDRDGGPFALGRFWGYRTSVVGVAYDLCYEAWEPEFRQQVEDYLDWILYKCLHRLHRVGTVNWTPGSNYTVVIHAGNGMAALALAGWLWIGPFQERVPQHEHPFYDYAQPVDCLAAMGGMAGAGPVPGQKVTFKTQTLEWKPLSKQANPDVFEGEFQHTGKTLIKCYNLASRRENTHLFFYTVLENEKPGWYQFDGPFYEGKCFLAGQRILHGDHFFAEKGRFPLLVPVVMADGEYSCMFQFLDSSGEKAKQYYADPARQQAYETAGKQYAERLARWQAADGANVDWLDHADRLRHWNYLNPRCGMGEGGFQGEGEGYTLDCHHVLHDYACCYQNVCGRGVTGFNDIGYFAPRYIMTGVWMPQDGRGPQERCFSQSFGGHGGGTIPARYLARSIALCPKQWQPVVLWHWHEQLGVPAEELTTQAGAKKAFSGREFGDASALVEAFINTPLDVKPAGPDGVFPHVWEAKTRGFYKVTITFASKAFCDATVAIGNARGKILRHLACGVLGPKAPEPLHEDSLQQTIVWDGKNDKGEYVDDQRSVTVRVSVGTIPRAGVRCLSTMARSIPVSATAAAGRRKWCPASRCTRPPSGITGA